MILRRLGNKKNIADKIIQYFPDHKIYIELFFGAGGMFFNKPKVKYNFLNDIDSDIFNLFMMVKNRRHELYKAIDLLPIDQNLMQYWKKNQEEDLIYKAVRFLFISNFTYLSKGYNLKFTADNTKKVLLSRIEPTFKYMSDAKFMSVDFRDVLSKISFQDNSDLCKKSDCFIYSDPPYVNTDGWYTYNSFSEHDVIDNLELLIDSDIKFAISEFDNPFILEQAKKRNLYVHIIGERRNLKNRRTEILITNYKKNQLEFFNV